MDGARDDLLAGARLAEDQHRRVRCGDLLDALHHAAQAGARADDGVGDVLAIEPRQQRALVGLERLAQARELVEARVVRQRDAKRLEQRLRERLV